MAIYIYHNTIFKVSHYVVLEGKYGPRTKGVPCWNSHRDPFLPERNSILQFSRLTCCVFASYENYNSDNNIHFGTVFVCCFKSEYNLVTVDSCMPDESRLQSHVATLFNSTRELEYKSAYSPDKIHLTWKIKHDSVLLYSTFQSSSQQLACMI